MNKILRLFNNKYFVLPFVLFANCFLTLVNHYPILYSDTSTYLASGFELETPFDRPITYGILLRIFSLNGLSLLFVPIFQSLLLLGTLYNVLKLFSGTKNIYLNLFVLSIMLVLTSGFNWSINQLLPDFFTSLGFLSLLCILISDARPAKQWPLFILFFVATASHLSNLFVYAALILIFILLNKRLLPHLDRIFLKTKITVLASILAISFLIMMSAFSKSKHIFYAGSLAEKGILQKILKVQCASTPFKLCAYQDSIPASFEYFVWNEKSPLYQLGGWKANRAELKTIAGLSLSNPEYLFMQIKSSSILFLRQLTMFDVGEGNGAFDRSTILMQRIKQYLPGDQISEKSLQSKGAFLHLNGLNRYYFITALLSFLLLVYLLITRYKFLDPRVKLALILLFLLITLSAFQVAFSSEISNRHGGKLVWLFILFNFLILSSKTNKKQQIL